MALLPKLVTELSSIEKFNVKGYRYINDKRNLIEVISEDGREYFLFGNDKVAKNYAIKVYIKYEDDPEVYEDLEFLGQTIEEFAKERIEKEGVQSILSYDQHHKVKLTGNALAYRAI